LIGLRWRVCEGLADVLEVIVDRLDERALAQQELVRERQQAVAHVLAQAGDELDALVDQEPLGERLWNVALVPKELAKGPFDALKQRRDGLAVVDVAAREAEGEQLAALVDDEVELEAVEPAERGLAARGVESMKLIPVQRPICVCR